MCRSKQPCVPMCVFKVCSHTVTSLSYTGEQMSIYNTLWVSNYLAEHLSKQHLPGEICLFLKQNMLFFKNAVCVKTRLVSMSLFWGRRWEGGGGVTLLLNFSETGFDFLVPGWTQPATPTWAFSLSAKADSAVSANLYNPKLFQAMNCNVQQL